MRYIPDYFCFSRIVLTAPIFVLILINTREAFIFANALFVLASFTDYLDGYSARRLGIASTKGAFLDLTADKIFISVILVALLQVGFIPAWVVAVILAREFLVTGFRTIAMSKGKIIVAGLGGKVKTLITLLGIEGVILSKIFSTNKPFFISSIYIFNYFELQFDRVFLVCADLLILLAVFLTIVSGIEYIVKALPTFE